MLGISLALLVYATGAEIGKLMLSSMTVFFSSRHLTPKAAQLQQTLAALEETLTLRRDRDGELRVGPVEKGTRVRLPDNPLVRDLVTVQERQKSYEYAEYIVYSYYVECHELYDHSGAHLDFVAGAMPLFGLMGTVLGLISMFDSLGSVVTIESIAPQLALALKCTLYGVALLGALQDQRHPLRAAPQGARLRLRHPVPRAQGRSSRTRRSSRCRSEPPRASRGSAARSTSGRSSTSI